MGDREQKRSREWRRRRNFLAKDTHLKKQYHEKIISKDKKRKQNERLRTTTDYDDE